MPWADLKDLALFYQAVGGGPAIVFVHGSSGNHLSWWQQVPMFQTRFRCVVFDQRGFGRTAAGSSGNDARYLVEDLRALLDHLELEQAILVGQSYGGIACMGMAVAYPERVRGLVMASSIGTIVAERLRTELAAYRRTIANDFAGRTYPPGLRLRRPDLAFLYDCISALNPPRGPFDERRLPFPATSDALASWAIPTLFVAGGLDQITPAPIIRMAASRVGGASYSEVPQCGHSVYFEDAERFNAILGEFLQAVDEHGRRPAT